MAFWGIEVKPGQPYIHRCCDKRGRLHVSQAILGDGSSFEKTILQCEVGNKKPIYLCLLLPKGPEDFALNLEFEEDADVTFSVVGSHSVHLSGFFNGGNEDKDDVEEGNIDAKCHGVEVTRENTEPHGSSGQRDATITKNEVKRKKKNKKREAAKKIVSAQESGIPNTSGTEESLLAETGNDPKPSSEKLNLSVMEKGKSLLAGKGQPKHLVICFSPLSNANSTHYSFVSYPVSKLICASLKGELLDEASCNEFTTVEKPEDEFVWCDQDDLPDHCKSRYYGMSFLHVGGGKVYVVGGMEPQHPFVNNNYTPNKVFRCISLTTPLKNSTVNCMRSMNGVKYYPLIAEMGGFIYVLSGLANWLSRHTNKIAFEVYDPSKNKWKVLPPPPFINLKLEYCRHLTRGLTHVVIDGKLCVSTERCSCIFDPKEQKWETCNIFPEGELEKPKFESIYDLDVNNLIESGFCGPPFPFWVNGIFYREDILLCAKDTSEKFVVVAFKIEKLCGGAKAVQMQVHFDDNFPTYCMFIHLVNLGDGYVAGLAWEQDKACWFSEELSIVIFKVILEMTKNGEGEVLTCEFVNRTRINVLPDPEEGRLKPMCYFTM